MANNVRINLMPSYQKVLRFTYLLTHEQEKLQDRNEVAALLCIDKLRHAIQLQ
jgi:hypothetical protein